MRFVLRLLAIALAVHGTVFAAAALAGARVEGPMLSQLVFWLLIAPALILAVPFQPLLWELRLMEGTGWFAWPNALGFMLVYAAWIALFFAASFLFRKRA